MDLLIYSFLIQFVAVVISPFFRCIRKASIVNHFFLLIGLSLGLYSSLRALIFSVENQLSFSFFNFPNQLFRFDALGLYFLVIVQLIAIPTTIYSFSYLKHYIDIKRPIKSLLTSYSFLMIATQITVIANHSILFLIAWEVMSTSAYLGMSFNREENEVQSGSFYYLIMSHVIMYFLFVFFFLLHNHSNSWYFTDFHVTPGDGNIFVMLYILALISFGMKAGFMPFHFWLPRAHPIAPSMFSAFLSGVLVKTGIYGIFRTYQFLNPVPEWIGWLVLSISIISAIFGVWYALAQHDIKKLLAYHTVENIGIIGLGIGLGFIGSAYNSPVIKALGFGGALLHTLNHAIFKNLLFIGSGVIVQNLGTRNIELMGGLIHRSKYFVVLFLIGSIAISGIPPLNGFISEYLIFAGFFATAKELQHYYPLMMLISAVCLAFVGGLAVACFTKINSIMFLGTPRREIVEFKVSAYDYISLGYLAALCLAIGFYPQPILVIINKVLVGGFIPEKFVPLADSINWSLINVTFASIVIGFLVIYLLKFFIHKKYGKRVLPAWGCGYENIDSRMQYTASSFANELNEIPKAVLNYHKNFSKLASVLPVKTRFESHSEDLIDFKVLIPIFKKISSSVSSITFLSQTDIRYYIAFILVAITVYSMIAFLWS